MRQTQTERIAILETRVETMIAGQKELHIKIEELIALRNKGAGVFWFASVMMGGVFAVLATLFSSWIGR